MIRRAQQRERAAQRAQGMVDQPYRPAGHAVQAAQPVSALRPFRHAEEIVGRDPFAAFRRRIGHGVEEAGLPIAADQAVEHQPIVFSKQQNGPISRILGFQRTDAHGVAIPDRWIHAGPARAKDHGCPLKQQVFDDFFAGSHRQMISQMER